MKVKLIEFLMAFMPIKMVEKKRRFVIFFMAFNANKNEWRIEMNWM